MKIYREMNLNEFKFWSGAKDTVSILSGEELTMLQDALEDMIELWSETQLNDFFWFDNDWIANFFGYVDFEEMWSERRKNR